MSARVYHIRWRVPVTSGDGQVYVTASPGMPVSLIAAQAVKNLTKLAEACPAGGIMPEPLAGEEWALTPRDHSHPRLTGSMDVAEGAYDLVLLDRAGAPYDPSELVRTRSA
jgi:hypothetical protein